MFIQTLALSDASRYSARHVRPCLKVSPVPVAGASHSWQGNNR